MGQAGYLVIGANGLIGRRVGVSLAREKMGWTGTRNKRNEDGLVPLDITDAAGVSRVFTEYAPKTVFLCANLAGGVNFCEKNPGPAWDFHVGATRDIGGLCRKTGATLVFISTDYVFDGTKGPYGEGDATNPLNLYGKLKLEAERWIEGNLERYLIVRTTNVFGWDPKTATPNYMMQLYRTVTEGRPFNAPSFLWGNPTLASELADAMVELCRKGAKGVFHVVGSSFIDRYDWAMKACDALGLDPALIREIKEPEPAMVPRPFRSWLSTEKFTDLCGRGLSRVEEAMEKFKREMRE